MDGSAFTAVDFVLARNALEKVCSPEAVILGFPQAVELMKVNGWPVRPWTFCAYFGIPYCADHWSKKSNKYSSGPS